MGHGRAIEEGGRVLLAEMEEDEAGALAGIMGDGEILDGIDPRRLTFARPFGEQDALAFIRRARAEDDEDAGHHYGAYLKDGGELVGVMSVGRVDRRDGSAEIGFWIAKRMQGRGLGKEAVALLERACFGALGLRRIHALVEKGNARSASLLKGLGFSDAGTMLANGTEARVFLKRAADEPQSHF